MCSSNPFKPRCMLRRSPFLPAPMFDCDNQLYIESKRLTFNPTYSTDEYHLLALDFCQGLGDSAPELGGTVQSEPGASSARSGRESLKLQERCWGSRTATAAPSPAIVSVHMIGIAKQEIPRTLSTPVRRIPYHLREQTIYSTEVETAGELVATDYPDSDSSV